MRPGTITSVAQKFIDKFERGEPLASRYFCDHLRDDAKELVYAATTI
jgi:hypothetical protein